MAFTDVNIGSAANDGTGDPLRTAFNKLNTNFTDAQAQLDALDTKIEQAMMAANFVGSGVVRWYNKGSLAASTQISIASSTKAVIVDGLSIAVANSNNMQLRLRPLIAGSEFGWGVWTPAGGTWEPDGSATISNIQRAGHPLWQIDEYNATDLIYRVSFSRPAVFAQGFSLYLNNLAGSTAYQYSVLGWGRTFN